MSLYENGRTPLRQLMALPEDRIAVPRRLDPRQSVTIQQELTGRAGDAYLNPQAAPTEFMLWAVKGSDIQLQVLGDGTVKLLGGYGNRTAATSAGAFAANYYIAVKDIDGNALYIPAMAAAW